MAQAVEPTQVDQIRVDVQLRKIPHSQTKLASQPEGFGLMGHVSHAREEINAAGNVDGKLRNAILWCHAAKVCGRVHITGYVFAFTRPSMPVT